MTATRKKGCTIAAGVTGLLAAVALLVLTRDDPPPVDADLLVDPTGADAGDSPESNKALADLLSAPFPMAAEDFDETLSTRLAGMLDGLEPADAALIDGLLAEHGELLDALESALADPGWRLPLRAYDDPAPEIDVLVELGQLLELAVLAAVARGAPDEALARASTLMRLGTRAEQSAAALLHAIVGAALVRQGAHRLAEAAAAASPSEAPALRATRDTLAGLPDPRDGFARALRGEYHGFREAGTRIMGPSGGSTWQRLPLVYQPNRTLRFFADATRERIADLDRPWSEQTDRFGETVASWNRRKWRLYLSGNPVGRILISIALPAQEPFGRAAFVSDFHRRAAIALVAARLHELDTGAAPDSLEALVPALLPDVPADPFDPSRPLGYLPARRLVWSVGSDLVDDPPSRSAPASESTHTTPWLGLGGSGIPDP